MDNAVDPFSQLSYETAKLVDENYTSKSNAVRQEESFDKLGDSEMVNYFYQNPSDPILQSLKPWKLDPHYFKTSYVSSLALTKMATHARSGGSIEIMGMLTGKIFANCIVVMDCYPLPVEGTETRVNAQSEGYEFMVQYLDALKKAGRQEDIVGWYHSHPGYGCWLSGIDVATQLLNQQFQDPYLAIVVDPERTIANHKIEIGAFRTLPNDVTKKKQFGKTKLKATDVPESKLSDFGVHHDRYYSLEVKYLKSPTDVLLIKKIYNSQTTDLTRKPDRDFEEKKYNSILKLSKDIENTKILSMLVNAFPPPDSRRSMRRHHHNNNNNNNSLKNLKVTLGDDSDLLPSDLSLRDVHPRLNSVHRIVNRSLESALNSADVTESEPDEMEVMDLEMRHKSSELELHSDEDVDEDEDDEEEVYEGNALEDSDFDIGNSNDEMSSIGNSSENRHSATQLTELDTTTTEYQPEKELEPVIEPVLSSVVLTTLEDNIVQKSSKQLLQKIGTEISRVFREPSMNDIRMEAGKLTIDDLIELLTVNVQRQLFTDSS